MDYELYKKARWGGLVEYGPSAPFFPPTAGHAKVRVEQHLLHEAAKARAATLGLNFKDGRDAVSRSPVSLTAFDCTGFDRAHLSATVEVRPEEDWMDTVRDSCTNQGFELIEQRINEEDEGREWEEYSGRPDATSVRVDLGSPRGRSSWYWLRVEPKERKHFLPEVKGVSKHEWLLELQRLLRAAAESQKNYVESVLANRMENVYVKVRLFWRGEEIADASTGYYEFEWKSQKQYEEQIGFVVLDLVHEALHGSHAWAKDAEENLLNDISRTVRKIALLPELALEHARREAS